MSNPQQRRDGEGEIEQQPASIYYEIIRSVQTNPTFVAAIIGVWLLLGVVWAHLSPPVYTVTLQITPVVTDQSPASGRFGGLASLAGINIGQNQNSMNFDLYLAGLKGRAAADELARQPGILRTMFAGEWDDTQHTWRQPQSRFGFIRKSIGWFLGYRAIPWTPPNGAQVQQVLAGMIDVYKPLNSPIATVTLRTNNPEWGRQLLWALHHAVDDALRKKTMARATDSINYLNKELATVTVSDYREALISTLSDQEKIRMAASAKDSFAAEPVEPPAAPNGPTSPNPMSIIFGALVVGAIFATLLAWLKYRLDISLGEVARRLRARFFGEHHLDLTSTKRSTGTTGH